jgi:hypothetical protein
MGARALPAILVATLLNACGDDGMGGTTMNDVPTSTGDVTTSGSTSPTSTTDSTGPAADTTSSSGEPGTTTGSPCAVLPTCVDCRDCVTNVGGACEVQAAACRADFDCGGLFECCSDAPDTCAACCNKLGTPPSIELLQTWDTCVVAECPACAPLVCD